MIVDFGRDPYLRLLRPFAEAYLALCRVCSRQIQSMGVTPSQFDVIAEFGGRRWINLCGIGASDADYEGHVNGCT